MSRKVAHNALWNVGGQVVSLGVGLVALPILLHALGAARLGVFTLALGLGVTRVPWRAANLCEP